MPAQNRGETLEALIYAITSGEGTVKATREVWARGKPSVPGADGTVA
ncbi:MAG: hypothetical protein IPP88_18830 [Betaproteobacteria bacterium]|nr:hypothetical protein [Betaproteobacteria bacterium]